MRMRLVAGAFVLALVSAACGGGGGTGQGRGAGGQKSTPRTDLPPGCVDLSGQNAVVVALDNEFDPLCMALEPGQDVTVRNDGISVHTFSIPGTDIDVTLQPGDEVVAEAVGDAAVEGDEIEYFCHFHPSMVGYLNRA
jgi:plastocyanin